MTDKTHTLRMTFVAGNGRRVTKDFPLTTEQATDPAARANAISSASFYGDGQGWRTANWTITEGASA